MAAGAIARVLAGLIGKHGLARGIKIAQKLGFKNKEIQGAVKKMTKQLSKRPKSTFQQRKGDRMYAADQQSELIRRQKQMERSGGWGEPRHAQAGNPEDPIFW